MKQRQKSMLVEGFSDRISCPTIERGAGFVRSAVLLAGVH